MRGGLPAPKAQPCTVPGIHLPCGLACQYDQYAEAGAPLQRLGRALMVQTKPGIRGTKVYRNPAPFSASRPLAGLLRSQPVLVP
jgi:hypothetical protein